MHGIEVGKKGLLFLVTWDNPLHFLKQKYTLKKVKEIYKVIDLSFLGSKTGMLMSYYSLIVFWFKKISRIHGS